MFDDRADAARQLAGRLAHLRGSHPLILAVPRGAVPMGVILAQALDGDLDVVLVRKLGAPGNPEYAIGAVDEAGHVSLNPDMQARVDAAYVAAGRSTPRRGSMWQGASWWWWTTASPPVPPCWPPSTPCASAGRRA